ncbi:hypothetical protein Tco_0810287 [Tanacetum coccineum]
MPRGYHVSGDCPMIACHVAATMIYLMQVRGSELAAVAANHWRVNLLLVRGCRWRLAAGQSGGDTWQVQAGRRMIMRLLEGAIIGWHLSANDWRIVGSDASRRQMISYD